MNIQIDKIPANSLVIIQEIAYQTWPKTYGDILSKSQIDYMLGRFYATEHLQESLLTGSQFYVAIAEGIPAGFIEIKLHQQQDLKLEKLYVLPHFHGNKIGQAFMHFFEQQGVELAANRLFLNVNKYNKAVVFYQKMGFNIAQEISIDIGNGYYMDDFIMDKSID